MNSNENLTSNTENSQGSDFGTPYEVRYPNGQIEKKGYFLNGVLNGPYVCYYYDGQMEEQCVFKNGELDGLYISYYSNGQLEKKCTFKEGALDGHYEEYDRRGNLLCKGIYHNNRFISDDEMRARQKVNKRLKELNETMPPTLARQVTKRREVINFRALYPKSYER